MSRRLPLAPELAVENAETARFRCVFPVCGGVCCRNGRPSVPPDEAARIDANLAKFLPLVRPGARARIERDGWLTNRVKEGHRTAAVDDGWCVFENGGCILQKVGMDEGEPWRYKPAVCVRFPLEKAPAGDWYVRQWGYRGEVWKLFCLNPDEDPTPARDSLRDEIGYVAAREASMEDAARTESPQRRGER